MTREPARRGRGGRSRRFVRERDWEFAFKRSAMVFVIVPAVIIIGEAAWAAESGDTWWPWALAGAVWVLIVGLGSAVFWLRMIRRGNW